MVSSVKGREPFLDHRLSEGICRFDESVLIQKGSSKWLLKRLTKKLGTSSSESEALCKHPSALID